MYRMNRKQNESCSLQVTVAGGTTESTSTPTATSSASGGKPSWSSVTVGDTQRGNVVGQQSPLFQDEFPTLKSAGEEKPKDVKKEEDKDTQYGPGPSLRPQSKLFLVILQHLKDLEKQKTCRYMDMFVNVKNVKESLQLQVHLPNSAIFWIKLYVGDVQG